MSQQDLRETGVERDLEIQVDHLAHLAQQSGLDGVVCSAQETQRLRQSLGYPYRLVTPGIRPSWWARDDQTRIVTPHEAIKNGSDYLVIGRPITASTDPEQSIAKIIAAL
jgi:orotidine-5'-phosphate decarboxylase